MLKSLFAVLVTTLALSQSASAVVIVFDVGYTPTNVFSTATLTGTDANNDLLLEFNELTSFSITGTNFTNLTLASLVDTGTVDLANLVWIGDGISWINSPDVAFFTWNNRGSSVADSWANTYYVSGGTVVPAPASLALLGLGLLALGIRRKHI